MCNAAVYDNHIYSHFTVKILFGEMHDCMQLICD